MIITCISNNGFEDKLTVNFAYKVKELGTNSYLIENDEGRLCWYGESKFEIKLEAEEEALANG
jgi:hypothetical protein